ncbi:hypothetical protein [Hyalangium versicolor]|uniref:hypothetical protein n=1 Tax=Hyalangium versicolor TaxID=2861190 RepID=UPI001CCD5E89|nr:hypothetical protein [Hyalangium versicolor]
MKSLTLQDSNGQDGLDLYWDGILEPQMEVEFALEPFFQALETHAGEWLPDFVEGKRRRRYMRAAVWKALEERRDEYGSGCGLYHTTEPFLDMALSFGLQQVPRKLSVSLGVKPLTFFTQEEPCRKLVELVRAWSSHYPVLYASAHSGADEQLADAPYYGRDKAIARRDGFDKIYEVCWLNVFGPRLVAQVGRDRMLSTPAHRVEELPNGSVLLVTWPTAADFTRQEARQAQARALVHLRPELDYDTVLRALHERNAAFIPVDQLFHPDVAPLLTRLLNKVGISKRQRRIAELNAYQPPEPEEWLPANAALPSDVPDTKAAIEHYSLLAEYLVALLHTEVPSVFEQTPESLTDVDFQFWVERFPETFERQHIDQRAVPTVGAYLGQVLVRYLGGQWIPRKKLEETQVRVGQRVWLPFVRAHKYMRSSQSLLDFSLTQLYRVAERHREGSNSASSSSSSH